MYTDGHARNCGYHCDQMPHECDCGMPPRPELFKRAVDKKDWLFRAGMRVGWMKAMRLAD